MSTNLNKNEVKVFSKPDCVYCKRLKQWLTINGHDFIEVDVSLDEEDLAYVRANGNLEDGVIKMPQVQINGEFISHQPYSNLEPYLNNTINNKGE